MAVSSRSGQAVSGLFATLALAGPLAAWLMSVGNPMEYVSHTVPPGQLAYVLSKLAGLLAIGLLWLQCLSGLARRSPVLTWLPPPSRGTHVRLGLAVLVFALAHFGLFFTAASLRGGHLAWALLVPDFGSGYFNAYVALGLIALALMVWGAFAGWRALRGSRIWQKVHFVWIPVFALGFLHSFALGTESRDGGMRYLYLFMAASLLVAALSRGVSALGQRRMRQGQG